MAKHRYRFSVVGKKLEMDPALEGHYRGLAQKEATFPPYIGAAKK